MTEPVTLLCSAQRLAVSALPSGDLVAVVDLQAHFLAKVQPVRWVVPGDSDSFAIDETVEPERGTQRGDLLHDLLHLAVRERHFIEPILAAIVLKEDLLPVRQQVGFARLIGWNESTDRQA